MNTAQRYRLRNLLLISTAVMLLLVFRDSITIVNIRSWVSAAGVWAPVLFVLVFVLGVFLVLPTSLFMLAGGALFGPVLGSIVSIIGATLSAFIAFFLARHFLAARIRSHIGQWGERIITGVDKEGWKFVAFTRLVPLFPYHLVSYAFGLTRIGTLPFIIATAVFIIPGSVVFTYLGYAGFATITGAGQLYPWGLLAAIGLAATYFIGRRIYLKRHGSATTTLPSDKQKETPA